MTRARTATLPAISPLILLMFGASCSAPGSSGRNSPSSAPISRSSVDSQNIVQGPSATYRITSTDDLQGSLQEALSTFEYAHRGERSTFLVEFLPGVYRGTDTMISLEASDDSDVAIIVFCSGSAPARLYGGGIHIRASAVTVRNLVFDDAWGSDALVYVRFRTYVTLDRIAVIDGLVTASDAEESLISLAGPGHVTVKDSWFIGNSSRWPSEAVFRLPLPAAGNAETTTIDIENVVFAGNESPCAFRPGWANARLRNVVFYEPKVTHSLICLAHPPHTLSIDGGIFVAGPQAIDYQVSEHLQRSDYKTVAMTGTTVRLPAPIPPSDAIQKNVRHEPAHRAPSLEAVTAAARRGGAPNPTELGL